MPHAGEPQSLHVEEVEWVNKTLEFVKGDHGLLYVHYSYLLVSTKTLIIIVTTKTMFF